MLLFVTFREVITGCSFANFSLVRDVFSLKRALLLWDFLLDNFSLINEKKIGSVRLFSNVFSNSLVEIILV